MEQENLPNGVSGGDDKKPEEPKDLVKKGNGAEPFDKLEKPDDKTPPGSSSISRFAKDAAGSAKIAAQKREDNAATPKSSALDDSGKNSLSAWGLPFGKLSSEEIKHREQKNKFEAQKIPPFTFPDIDPSELPWLSEKKEKKVTVPVSSLPLPYLVAPFLDLKEPVDEPKNQTRLEFVYRWVTNKFGDPQSLKDLIEQSSLKTEALGENYRNKTIETIRVFLQQHGEFAHLDLREFLEDLSKHPREEVAPEVLIAIGDVSNDISRTIEHVSKLSSSRYTHPPTLCPGMLFDREDNLGYEALAFINAHLFQATLETEEAVKTYNERQESVSDMAPHIRLKAAISYHPGILYNEYSGKPEAYPPFVGYQPFWRDKRRGTSKKGIEEELVLKDKSKTGQYLYRDEARLDDWLLGFPPKVLLQDLVNKYETVFAAFGDPIPSLDQPKLDVSCLVTSKPDSREQYRADAWKLRLYYEAVIPSLLYEERFQNLSRSSLQPFSRLIKWFQKDAIAYYKTRSHHDSSLDMGRIPSHFDVIPATEDIYDLRKIMSLLSHEHFDLVHGFYEKEPLILLTKLFISEYSNENYGEYSSFYTLLIKQFLEDKLLFDNKISVSPSRGAPDCLTVRYLYDTALRASGRSFDPTSFEKFAAIFRDVSNKSGFEIRFCPHDRLVQALENQARAGTIKRSLAVLYHLPVDMSPNTSFKTVLGDDGATSHQLLTLANDVHDIVERTVDILRLGDEMKGHFAYQYPVTAQMKEVWDRMSSLDWRNKRIDSELFEIRRSMHFYERRERRLRGDVSIEDMIKQAAVTDPMNTKNSEWLSIYDNLRPDKIKEKALQREKADIRRQILEARKEADKLRPAYETAKSYPVRPQIRPFLSSITTMLLRERYDRDITDQAGEEDREKYSLDPSESGKVTARGRAAVKLIDLIRRFDVAPSQETTWEDDLKFLEEARHIMFEYENVLMQPPKPPNNKLLEASLEDNVVEHDEHEPIYTSERKTAIENLREIQVRFLQAFSRKFMSRKGKEKAIRSTIDSLSLSSDELKQLQEDLIEDQRDSRNADIADVIEKIIVEKTSSSSSE